MRLDIPRREAPRIEREDLVVEPLEPTLALADDLRLKAPVAITRRVDRTRPCSVINVFGVDPLRVLPVPPGGSWWGS